MSLKDTALEITARIDALRDWTQRKFDATALSNRRLEWKEHGDALKRLSEQLEWIDAKSAALVAQQAQVAMARSLILKSQQILEDGGNNSALTEDSHWAKAVGATGKSMSQLGDFMKVAWRKYVDDLGAFRAPTEIGATLPLSRPGNRALLESYSVIHAQYKRLAGQNGPAKREDVAALQGLAVQLGELGRRFNHADVSDAVRDFFGAIDSGSGAPLSLLTSEVRDWLEGEKLLDAFTVVGAR